MMYLIEFIIQINSFLKQFINVKLNLQYYIQYVHIKNLNYVNLIFDLKINHQFKYYAKDC
jgi:hypothetical protein